MRSDERQGDDADRIQELERELDEIWMYLLLLSSWFLFDIYLPRWTSCLVILAIMGRLFMKRVTRYNARRQARVERKFTE